MRKRRKGNEKKKRKRRICSTWNLLSKMSVTKGYAEMVRIKQNIFSKLSFTYLHTYTHTKCLRHGLLCDFVLCILQFAMDWLCSLDDDCICVEVLERMYDSLLVSVPSISSNIPDVSLVTTLYPFWNYFPFPFSKMHSAGLKVCIPC